MTDTPKPPMVVWLTGKQLPCVAVSRSHSIWAEQGPYVHLDQFLDEAKKRSKKQNLFLPDVIDQMVEELSKELKEQNEN